MANLENSRLAVFRAVAETLSFRKAAEQLYLTQPAVSLQIKAIEEDLGVQLFHRTGRAVALSPAGVVLLRYARQTGNLLLMAEQEIAALHGVQAGNLALGASTTIAQYLLPSLLSGFRKLHPRVHPTLMSGNTEKIVEAVEKRDIALGLIEGPAQSRHVKTQPFLSDELVPLVASSHPWAAGTRVSCAQLGAAPLLMRERGSGSRRVVEMALERCGLKRSALKIAMELDSTEAIKSAVEAGLGIGFVSRCALAKDLRMGRSFGTLEVEGLSVQRDLLVVQPAGPGPQGLAMEFRNFLLSLPARGPKPRPGSARVR